MSNDNTIWKDVTDDFDREHGGERYLRSITPECWISVLYRLTGFGYYEWETAVVILKEVKDRPRTWKDKDCLIIRGDWREELSGDGLTPEILRAWYEANIDGNRNSMGTLLEAVKASQTPGAEPQEFVK